MSNLVLTDAKIYVGPYHLSGQMNEVAIQLNPDMLDATTFGQGTRVNRPGLFDVSADGKGLHDFSGVSPDNLDENMFGLIGAASMPFSIAPLGNSEGDRVYSFRAVRAQYNPVAGTIGQLQEFSVDGKATGARFLQGTLMGTGAKIVTGTGAGQVLGAVGVTQRLIGALHVVAASGTLPTLDVIIESAAAGDPTFVTPTTRLTFAQRVAMGSEWKEVSPGVITDTRWRAKWTISGTTPSFTVYIVFGISN